MFKRYKTRDRIYTHRIRAEQALGKPLPPNAEVHHADGSTSESAPLVICQDSAYHSLLHMRMRIVKAGGDPNTQRVCGCCKQLKSFDEMAKKKAHGTSGYDGQTIHNVCKLCTAARVRATYRKQKLAS